MIKLPSIIILIQSSVKQYRKQFRSLLKIIALYFLFSNLLFFTKLLPRNNVLRSGIAESIITTIEIVLTSYITLLLIQKISNTAPPTIKKIFLFLVLTVIAMMTTFGGMFLFVIPGVLMLLYLSIASYILVIENKSVIESINRSRLYIKGIEWQVLIRLIFPFIPLVIFGLLPVMFPIIQRNTALKMISPILTTLFYPLEIIYVYLMYKAIVSQKEIKNEKVSKRFTILLWVTCAAGIFIYTLATIATVLHIG